MVFNKKAFTLSINMLVTMILMVVIFSFGIYLFSSIFQHAEEMELEVRTKEMDQLNLLLDDNALVTVLNPQQTYKGEPLRFPIGITNEGGGSTNFDFESGPVCTFTSNLGVLISNLCPDILLKPNPPYVVENNQRDYRLFVITPRSGDSNGFYSITFTLEKLNLLSETWGSPQMIIVNVP